MTTLKTFGLIVGTRRFTLDVDPDAGSDDRFESPWPFRFTHRNANWWGKLDEAPAVVTLLIGTDLGLLPFSAESAVARHSVSTILAAANAQLRGAFRLSNGHILVSTSLRLDHPVTAPTLVNGIVRALLPLNPYIDMILLCQAFKGLKSAAKGPRRISR